MLFERMKKELNMLADRTDGLYLCSVFFMCSEEELDSVALQFDFWDSHKKKMVSYVVDNNRIEPRQEAEPFVGSEKNLEKLDIKSIKFNFGKAYLAAKECLIKYNDSVAKIILVLQSINNIPIWNISFVTSNFFLFNTKINAENGSIAKEEYSSLLAFKK